MLQKFEANIIGTLIRPSMGTYNIGGKATNIAHFTVAVGSGDKAQYFRCSLFDNDKERVKNFMTWAKQGRNIWVTCYRKPKLSKNGEYINDDWVASGYQWIDNKPSTSEGTEPIETPMTSVPDVVQTEEVMAVEEKLPF